MLSSVAQTSVALPIYEVVRRRTSGRPLTVCGVEALCAESGGDC